MSKVLITLFAAVFIVAACNSTNESSTENDSTMHTSDSTGDGWINLFDGKTLNGWHSFNADTIGSAWKVVDGEIRFDTSNKVNGKVVGGGDIVTNDSFENFHLELEWNISKNGNSGIMFLTQEGEQYKAPYWTAPEMQVLDNDGHPDGKIPKHNAGDLYDLIAGPKTAVKGPGEWNKAEVILNNAELTLKLNGVEMAKTTMWTPAWDSMIAASKFKQWADFAKARSGKICLQDHGNDVAFRNIRIRKL